MSDWFNILGFIALTLLWGAKQVSDDERAKREGRRRCPTCGDDC